MKYNTAIHAMLVAFLATKPGYALPTGGSLQARDGAFPIDARMEGGYSTQPISNIKREAKGGKKSNALENLSNAANVVASGSTIVANSKREAEADPKGFLSGLSTGADIASSLFGRDAEADPKGGKKSNALENLSNAANVVASGSTIVANSRRAVSELQVTPCKNKQGPYCMDGYNAKREAKGGKKSNALENLSNAADVVASGSTIVANS